MSSILSFLFAYLLGGVTFIPLVVCTFLCYAYFAFPEVVREPPQPPLRLPEDDTNDVFQTEDEKLVRRLSNSADVATGYFLVTREFVPSGINGKPPERTSPAGSPIPRTESPSVYQSVYRSIFDRKPNSNNSTDSLSSPKSRAKRPRNEFYVVLRHGHLMLYDDEDQIEVRHVVALDNYTVDLYGGGDIIPEGELYIRRNAIRLIHRTGASESSKGGHSSSSSSHLPFYMFSEHCSQKEDFYLALVKHQERVPDDPAVPPKPLRYRQEDIIDLVKHLHSSEDQLQMNWINGLLGRVFLSVYRTPEIEGFFRQKITKKIARVDKPSFLSDVKLQHIDVGNSVPFITNPRLKEMTADGNFCCEADLTYHGGFRLEVAAKATVNLGSRFKPREVTLVLAVVLKKLEGHGLIRVKPPPSNRLWFSFERMPKMDLSIEPIVGSRQIAWGPVLRIIERRIVEVIAETLVYPFYDDIHFTDTVGQRFRGGIWHSIRSAPLAHPIPRIPTDNDPLDSHEQTVDASNAETEPKTEQPALSSPLPPEPQRFHTNGSTGSDDDSVNTSSTSPSIKSARKAKASRAHTMASIAPPSPSIGTEAINVTAIRSPDQPDATSAVMAIRSRSSSSPQFQSPMAQGSPGRAKTFHGKTTTEGEILVPIGSLSGGSAHSFGSNPSHEAAQRSPASEKTLNAIGTATAAVKKWYISRKTSTVGEMPEEPLTPHNLPPAEIPTPPQAKTAPINVPKRRNLPPPLRKSRKVPAPPLPARETGEGSAFGTGGEMLVVAAPISSPTTPQEEKSEDIFAEFGEADFLDSDSVSSKNSRSSHRNAGRSWERKHIRERALEETELWHSAEEAEMRARVPWAPDEV